MILDPRDVYKIIQPYRVKSRDELPKPYAPGSENEYHIDWKIKGLPLWAQPQTWVPRAWNAYRIPFPTIPLAGNQEMDWQPYDGKYPLAPGITPVERDWFDGNKTVKRLEILGMHPVSNKGWSLQGAWISGRWQPIFYTQSYMRKGKRYNFYYGAKPDYVDPMFWFEASASIREIKDA